MEEKVINLEVYNPRGKHVGRGCNTEYIHIGWCNNSENCEAYKHGKCVMFTKYGYEDGGIDRTGCPYGRTETKSGFTNRSVKCGQLTEKALQEHGDKLNAIKGLWQDDFIVIGDYIRIAHRLELFFQAILNEDQYFERNMIKLEAFTPEFIVKMIQLKAWQLPSHLQGKLKNAYFSLYGIPSFLKSLQREKPDIFEEVEKLYPKVSQIVVCRDIKRYSDGYCAGCKYYIWPNGGCSLCKKN